MTNRCGDELQEVNTLCRTSSKNSSEGQVGVDSFADIGRDAHGWGRYEVTNRLALIGRQS